MNADWQSPCRASVFRRNASQSSRLTPDRLRFSCGIPQKQDSVRESMNRQLLPSHAEVPERFAGGGVGKHGARSVVRRDKTIAVAEVARLWFRKMSTSFCGEQRERTHVNRAVRFTGVERFSAPQEIFFALLNSLDDHPRRQRTT